MLSDESPATRVAFFLPRFLDLRFFEDFFLETFFLPAFFLEAFFLEAFFLEAFFLEAFFLEAFFLEAFFLEAFFLEAFFLEAFFLEAFFLEAFFLEAFFLLKLAADSAGNPASADAAPSSGDCCSSLVSSLNCISRPPKVTINQMSLTKYIKQGADVDV